MLLGRTPPPPNCSSCTGCGSRGWPTARPEVEAAYGEFLALNSRFLTAVTNWQIRPERTDPLAALERFSGYPERYAAGLDKAGQGQRSWVDQPRIDSCHTVWMELHEDLLATLGLERGS